MKVNSLAAGPPFFFLAPAVVRVAMRTRFQPHQRRRIKSLQRAALAAIHSGEQQGFVLSQLSGFPHYSTFSEMLHARRVTATPLMTERLQRLARLLNFPPDQIFDPEPVEEREMV
jgi:hypothetical protein